MLWPTAAAVAAAVTRQNTGLVLRPWLLRLVLVLVRLVLVWRRTLLLLGVLRWRHVWQGWMSRRLRQPLLRGRLL